MRAWPFSKSKTPGFGISRGYYLTILSSRSVLPTLIEVVNPAGANGAATGLAVPLGHETDKSMLGRPIQLGPYAIATTDRKTVLKMLVISKEEVGYDPELYVRSSRAVDEDPELVARMRATWTITQLTFESHDPAVYPALDFFLGVAIRFARLSEGVIADSICERYRLPEDMLEPHRIDPLIDARDHIAVKFEKRSEGIHAYTLGMQKFALQEYEITNLVESDRTNVQRFLLTLCQSVLLGDLTKVGDRFGSSRALFSAADGGFDRGLWEGISVFELLPPTKLTASEALECWVEEVNSPN